MKQFFKWLGKHIAGAMVFSLFSILFIAGIVYALTYPSAPPVGEVAGGKFMGYFNKMLVNTGVTTDGKVNRAVLSDTTSQIGTIGADGKWCKVVGGKVECVADAPVGGGIGTRAFLSPLKNMEITCTFTNPYRAFQGWAKVDANGQPFTRAKVGNCDSGWIGGYLATCVDGVTAKASWNALAAVQSLSNQFSIVHLNPNTSIADAENPEWLGCTASFPL